MGQVNSGACRCVTSRWTRCMRGTSPIPTHLCLAIPCPARYLDSASASAALTTRTLSASAFSKAAFLSLWAALISFIASFTLRPVHPRNVVPRGRRDAPRCKGHPQSRQGAPAGERAAHLCSGSMSVTSVWRIV